MKADKNSVTNLINSYVNAIGYEEKKKVDDIACKVLSQSEFMIYIDKCMFYNSVDYQLIEAELGLSGVQNKDNL